MKKLLFLTMILCAGFVSAQDQFKNEVIGMMTFTKGRIAQLADAMPDEKYSWSPSDGVRSYSSVIGHVVSANYFFGMKLGGQLPEGLNPMTIENELKTKAALVDALNNSHEFITKAIKSLTADDMGVKVEMPFPGDFTKMSVVNIAMNHGSEHMGQMIAYARSNGVTPPWSLQQGE